MMSVAGAWFFLMTCEMFPIGNRDFRLPGLGSYLQTAANHDDTRAMIYGVHRDARRLSCLTDQLIWRPVIAWSNKFKFEQVESSGARPLAHPVRVAEFARYLIYMSASTTLDPLGENISLRPGPPFSTEADTSQQHETSRPAAPLHHGSPPSSAIALLCIILVAAFHAPALCCASLPGPRLAICCRALAATFLPRQSSRWSSRPAWTIPAGVAIGFHPRLARLAQPHCADCRFLSQPPILVPIILLALIHLGLGHRHRIRPAHAARHAVVHPVQCGCGRHGHPRMTLKEVSTLFRFGSAAALEDRHPARDFSLSTSPVSSPPSGGAWNASIIAEYFHLARSNAQHSSASARRSTTRLTTANSPIAAAGDHHHGHDGGDHQPAGLAAALPSRRNQIPTRRSINSCRLQYRHPDQSSAGIQNEKAVPSPAPALHADAALVRL